jgi:glucose/arabinose dehydrogenase
MMWRGMRAGIRIALLAGCLLALLLLPSRAGALGLQSIAPSFDQPIFAISPPGDPRLFVVERPGSIQVVNGGSATEFLDISALVQTNPAADERGLLSMAFDPNYASNGLFYVFYTGDGADAGGALGDVHIDEFRVSADPNAADAASRRTVWTFSHGASNHNGGQLQFGPDGYLYISVGDNAIPANAQSLANPHGKVLRIDPHGAADGDHGVPPDNPFLGGATPEIWSLGLRNPFRLSFDRLTGDLVIGDVGSSGSSVAEEIDFAPASAGRGRGTNFGWPDCEGFTGNCAGTTLPAFAYPHSDPGGGQAFGCAIIGGFVYRGSQAPEVAGRYLYADLCTAQLRSIQLGVPFGTGDRAEGASGALSSPRSFGEDSACNLYVMNTTTVYRIVGSAPGVAPACQMASAAPAVTPPTRAKKRKCKAKKKGKKRSSASAKKHKKKKCKKRKKRGRR